jgi:signal transduction histidine kinase
MQLFLAVTLIAAMALTVEVMDRRNAERASRGAISARTRAEVAAMTAASTERRRIVRETHDIVGHSMNVMLLQAGAARRMLATDADKSRELLESIESTGRQAFRDLDIALGLADRSADLQPAQGLASAPDLIDAMRRSGMHVELKLAGEPFEVPTLVDWSAHRILQEAVTNIAKHAPHGHGVVSITYEPCNVFLRVVNDGVETNRGHAERQGRGLAGMRERVAVLGGDIGAGPTADGHFALVVRLPVSAARS